MLLRLVFCSAPIHAAAAHTGDLTSAAQRAFACDSVSLQPAGVNHGCLDSPQPTGPRYPGQSRSHYTRRDRGRALVRTSYWPAFTKYDGFVAGDVFGAGKDQMIVITDEDDRLYISK